MAKELNDVFSKLSDHLADAAKHAATLGTAHRTKHTETGDNFHKVEAEAHEGMSECLKSASASCNECAEAMKAEIDSTLGKTIMPDKISSVMRSDVEGFGIKAVVRPGQPDRTEIDRSAVPPEFRHLVETSDGI